MPEYFTSSIIIDGCKKGITIKLLPTDYATKIQVSIDGKKLFFEPDEESQYRMIKMSWQNESDVSKFDIETIQQIILFLNDLKLNC